MGAAHQVLPLGLARVSLKIGRAEKNEVITRLLRITSLCFFYIRFSMHVLQMDLIPSSFPVSLSASKRYIIDTILKRYFIAE